MDDLYLQQLKRGLEDVGIECAAGLNDAEVVAVEQKYGFRFPPDLRRLLQYALPVSERFPNWREGSEAVLREMLEWPFEGMRFDIEHNTLWLAEWGEKPQDLADAVQIARLAVQLAPRLIPVMGHCYLPDEPHLAGNPVLSVWQTDIIYYGYDLADYFSYEFRRSDEMESRKEDGVIEVARPSWTATMLRPIRFWDKVMER